MNVIGEEVRMCEDVVKFLVIQYSPGQTEEKHVSFRSVQLKVSQTSDWNYSLIEAKKWNEARFNLK
jgi:hypothetical protein